MGDYYQEQEIDVAKGRWITLGNDNRIIDNTQFRNFPENIF